jgi:hypothetical protein
LFLKIVPLILPFTFVTDAIGTREEIGVAGRSVGEEEAEGQWKDQVDAE